jgi:hypothetical protein
MSRKSADGQKAKYRESEPDVTGTGIGKNYDRYRIFHTRKKDEVEYIGNDYSLRAPTDAELAQFKKDLAEAAVKERKVARYLEEFPHLGIQKEAERFKPEPEPIAKAGS